MHPKLSWTLNDALLQPPITLQIILFMCDSVIVFLVEDFPDFEKSVLKKDILSKNSFFGRKLPKNDPKIKKDHHNCL